MTQDSHSAWVEQFKTQAKNLQAITEGYTCPHPTTAHQEKGQSSPKGLDNKLHNFHKTGSNHGNLPPALPLLRIFVSWRFGSNTVFEPEEFPMSSLQSELFKLEVDSHSLASSPDHKDYLCKLAENQQFSDQSSFNSFCKKAIANWPGAPQASKSGYTDFANHLQNIEKGKDNTIATPWGGVDICSYAHPNVKKFLVVKKGGYLAFEKHELKEEAIDVREGFGILLYRNGNDSSCYLKLLSPGVQARFAPGEEHCIIGTENLLVYEESVDPKGMDQDLIFLFTPDPT